MGIFRIRKNKKFNYTTRYYDDKGQGSPFQIKHKFDEYRKTATEGGLKTKAKNAWEDLKSDNDRKANRRVLVIAAVLLLIFLFIIEFDLTIFFR